MTPDTTTDDRVRDSYRDWGEGCRSLSALLTGKTLGVQKAAALAADLSDSDCFETRERDGFSTSQVRCYLLPDETEQQAIRRLREVCRRHDVTLELLHGRNGPEWYELIHLAAHGQRWGHD